MMSDTPFYVHYIPSEGLTLRLYAARTTDAASGIWFEWWHGASMWSDGPTPFQLSDWYSDRGGVLDWMRE